MTADGASGREARPRTSCASSGVRNRYPIGSENSRSMTSTQMSGSSSAVGTQNRAIGDERQPEEGLIVPVGPEQNAVVFGAVLSQVLDERRHLWPVLDEPSFLFFWRRACREDDLADVGEPAEIALTGHGKPQHGSPVRPGWRLRDRRCATSRSPARSWSAR